MIRRWRIQSSSRSRSPLIVEYVEGLGYGRVMFYRCCWHVCTGRVPSPVSLQDFWCSQLAIYHIRSLIPWRCSRLNVISFWCPWRELRTSMGWAPGHCLWTSRGPHDCTCPGCPVIRQWILGRRRYKVVCRPQIDEMRCRSWRWHLPYKV